MLSIKKIFAIVLIATFLVSTPLALACISEEVFSVTFVYKYDDSYAKPQGTPGKGPPDKEDPEDQLGYEFLIDGYKWKDFPINVVLDDALVPYQSAVSEAMAQWDIHTGETLFSYSLTVENDATFDEILDGKNELVFGDYQTAGVIAVCSVWFSRRGRQIVEFDILFDTDFTWGIGEANKMDVQNIATHEIGHGLNLADLYDPQWSEQTMYGLAEKGETKKRTLDSGDIAGIQELYGAP